MKKYEIIAVDFDGTLCSDCYPDIGKPNLPLIELLKALKREGCRIVLWTCRCGRELEQAVQWCEEFGLEFDKVNRNTDAIRERFTQTYTLTIRHAFRGKSWHTKRRNKR